MKLIYVLLCINDVRDEEDMGYVLINRTKYEECGDTVPIYFLLGGKEIMKKMVVAIMAGTMLLSSGLQVNAAGMRDVFDANYYAEQYKDLKDAFGNNEEALYKHFVEYGLKEGRNMNPIIDIAKYRQQYEDLDKAYGDNWDAYVEHYFKYGVKEDRNNGTNFDVKKYKESYKDVKDAFGDDYEKIAKHYMEHGKKENRDKGHKNHEMKPGKKPHEKQEVALERSERSDNPDGSWSIIDYNAKGYCVKITYYKADGSLDCYMEFVNDANGVRIKELFYEATGELATTSDLFYHENGKLDYAMSYFSDGSYCIQKYNADEIVEEVINYDADGVLQGRTINVVENGELVGIIYYDAAGNVTMEYIRVVAEDGSITFVPVGSEEEDVPGYTGVDEYVNADGSKTIMEYVDGMLVKSSMYNANGDLDFYTIFIHDENGRETGYTTYDANGNVTGQAESRYDESGNLVETKFVDYAGFVSINQYDNVNGYHTILCYDAEGNFKSHDVYKWDENHEYVEGKAYDEAGNIICEYDMVKDADGNYTSVPKEA